MLCGTFEMKTAARKLRLIGKAGAHLGPEDDRLGHAVDHRTDDDPHRTADTGGTEPALDRPVGDEEDHDAHHHPERELPAVEHVFGLGDEVERDRRDQRAGAETGQIADETRGDLHPTRQEPGEQERRRPSRPSPNASSIAGILQLAHDRRHHPVRTIAGRSDERGPDRSGPLGLAEATVLYAFKNTKLEKTS